MCRVLAYLGDPVRLDDLLYAPDNSLVRQSYAPRRLRMLNLAGFGLAAWDPGTSEPDRPFIYHTTVLPVFDGNLRALAAKVNAGSVLAHVRGVEYNGGAPVGQQFLHPFLYPGVHVALAHNGSLDRFSEMRPLLQRHLRPDVSKRVRTNLDSEWIYAVFLSQLADPAAVHSASEIAETLVATLEILADVRRECGIATSSAANLFAANRRAVVAVRYVFDFGVHPGQGAETIVSHELEYLSLWYSVGRQYGFHDGEWKMIGGHRSARAVLLASEPLTRDESTWLEVPDYSLVSFDIGGGRPSMRSRFLSI